MLTKRSKRLQWGALSLGVAFMPRVASAAVGEHEGALARGDFDGDGDEDIAVSSPQDDCGKGVIHVRSGTTVVSWTRDTPGVLGAAACNQFFGTALAVGDFDDDGYDDLAVSAPGASDTGDARSGAVHVFYGGSGGLSTVGDQVWNQDTVGINGVAEPYDYMGDALEVGDFNCDGYDDLVIGVPREDLNAGADAGAVHVFYGSSGGVSTVDDWWHTGVSGVNGAPEPNDHFGGALAAGNFNGDTSSGRACDDLAIASPGESIGTLTNAGMIYIIDGGTSGLSTSGDQDFHQDSTNVEDSAEAYDLFGARLVSADENGDGYDDLHISVPGDSCEALGGEGTHVMFGSSSGISTVNDELRCNSYRCIMEGGVSRCRSNSPAVYGTGAAEDFDMFVGSDVIYAGSGNDKVDADFGDDVVFGGPGNDSIEGDAGADLLIGGPGNDTFTLTRDCDAQQGEVIDGGPGFDTVRSHLSESELIAAGVQLSSVESFVAVPKAYAGGCGFFAYDEGAIVPPELEVIWIHMPDPDDTYLTSGGEVAVNIVNTSEHDVDYDIVYHLSVRGHQLSIEDSNLALDSGMSMRQLFDLNRFVPPGIDTENIPPEILALPVSAQLRVEVKIRRRGSSEETRRAFSKPVWGHYESGEARLYREQLFSTTYNHGDLVGWRAGRSSQTRPYRYAGHIEATTPSKAQAQ